MAVALVVPAFLAVAAVFKAEVLGAADSKVER
jgi:predicted porin